MGRLIAATVLVLHLLFMLIVSASSKWMVAAVVLFCYLSALLLYFRKRTFPAIVLAASAAYLAILALAYIGLVIGSVQIEKPVNIWFHSFVFLPGIAAAAAYIGYVREDRRRQRAVG